VIEVMIRQLGHLFLQPMMDAMWRQLGRMRPADFSAASARLQRCSKLWAQGWRPAGA
jgi:hypothetical protein